MGNASSDRDVLLDRLADEFAARYRRGERPSLQEYVDRHPDLAGDIRELFPALAEMEQAKADGEKVEPLAAPAPRLRQLGDFRILRQIGQGGMGVVYEAEQISLGRHVALKVLSNKMTLDSKQKRRFEREAKAAAKLHHTNIVPVHGVGEHDGLPFYVMQFIQGLGLDEVMEELRRIQSGAIVGHDSSLPSPPAATASRAALPRAVHTEDDAGLRARLGARDVSVAVVANSLLTGEFRRESDLMPREHAPEASSSSTVATPAPWLPSAANSSDSSLNSRSSVSLPGHGSSTSATRRSTYWHSVAQIGAQVADALEYAHNQGVLHRDVKPSNLLLDTQGTVWVTDFGLAKADDQENLTQSGDLLGTLRYMAPEAFDGKSDRRSDVYGLGLTLYELLALRPAFDELDRHRLIKQVTTVEPTPLDRLNQTIPRDLVTMVHKAIEHEPDRRYATAGDLAADLRRFLADQPILARRPSTREQVVRWARHHPGVARSLAAIGLLLVLATLVSVVAAGRFRGIAREKGRLADDNARLAALKEEERIKAVGAQKEAEEARDEARRRGEAERWERYRANIAAATSALWVQNAPAARRYLLAAPEQHRNWEWRLLHSQLDGARTVMRGDHDSISNVAYSADDQLLASAGSDGRVILWDAESGRQLTVLAECSDIKQLEFCPTGLLLAAICFDMNRSTIRVWNGGTQQPVWSASCAGAFVWFEWSPDGQYLAASILHPEGSRPHETVIWDARTGNERAMVPGGNDHASVRFRSGGRYMIRSFGKTAGVWDLEEGREVVELKAGVEKLLDLEYSPDGRRIAGGTSHAESKVWLWDADTGREIAAMGGHTNTVIDVSFSPDGTRLASCSLDQTARLWDGVTGQAIAALRGHAGEVRRVLFTPDGKYLVTASADGTLRMWDGVNGEFIAVLRGHERGVYDVAIRPKGHTIASSSNDGTIRLWNVELARQTGILSGHRSFVYDIAVSRDGRQIASTAWDGTARFWDLATGQPAGLLHVPDEAGIIGGVAFHPDGRRMVTVGRGERVTMWDVGTREMIWELRVPTGGWTGDARAAFHPAGTMLAVGSMKGIVHLIDSDSGELVAALPVSSDATHEGVGNARDVSFRADGRLLAIASYDRNVHIWDVETRTQQHVLRGHDEKVYTVSFNNDGRWLASADTDGTVHIWDGSTFEPVATLPHRGAVQSVSFSPDGTRLATGCRDNSIRVWDTATWQEVAELRGHELYVHAVAWSRDGNQLISGSGDSTVRIWQSLSPQARFQSQKEDE